MRSRIFSSRKGLDLVGITDDKYTQDIPEDLRFGRCYIPKQELNKHGLEPEDLLDPENIDVFRPLYDEYLDLTNEHLDEAIEYIKMLPETQFRLKASCMLPYINWPKDRFSSQRRKYVILQIRSKLLVTRLNRMREITQALIIPGGVKRLSRKIKD